MPEFILAKYPKHRRVFVDGELAGFTNKALNIGASGFYDIDLGEPKNYTPASYDQEDITGHGAVNPKTFVFTPTWAVGAASNGDANGGDT